MLWRSAWGQSIILFNSSWKNIAENHMLKGLLDGSKSRIIKLDAATLLGFVKS